MNMAPAPDQILSFARDNNAGGIKAMIAAKCSPSFCNRMGQSALHIAALWGSRDAVEALLAAGADKNAMNKLGRQAPLHAAAMGRGPADRRAECIKLLLRYQADLNQAAAGGELPLDVANDEVVSLALGEAPLILHKAVRERSTLALENALGQVPAVFTLGAPSLESRDRDSGMTAAHTAADAAWRAGLEMLLGARADPNSQDRTQQTPAHAAVLAGDWACLESLLRARADVRKQDENQEQDPRFRSATFEEDPKNHRTALHYAASLGNVLAIRRLLEARSDPNCPDSNLETPLHLCLGLRDADTQFQGGCGVRESGNTRRLGAIVENGAIRRQREELVRSAAAHIVDRQASWPVLFEGASEFTVVEESQLERLADETLHCLLEARADVNKGSRHMGETRTVLHEAVRLGDVRLAERVLGARADLNRQDEKLGLSALHLAARSKHHGLVSILLQARADPELRTAGGRTAAELAQTNGAAAATVAILQGQAEPSGTQHEEAASAAASGSNASGGLLSGGGGPQRLESLTAEQRAMLFID